MWSIIIQKKKRKNHVGFLPYQVHWITVEGTSEVEDHANMVIEIWERNWKLDIEDIHRCYFASP